MTEDGKIETLANLLRDQIKNGDFGTKGRLPSVTQLAKDRQIARSTVYQALLLLQAEGLIFVKDNSHYVRHPLMRISGAPLFDKYLEQQGLKSVASNIVEPEVIQIPTDIAAMFKQPEGAKVIRRLRRHGTPDIAMRLQEMFFPLDPAQQFLAAMTQNPDLNVAGEIRKAYGITIAKRHDDVLARLPTAEEAQLLNIVRTTPIVEIRRHFLTQDDQTVSFAKLTLVAAYFLLSYDSTNDGGRA
jgi:DNA-binding GntR family transcriptional regulator